MDTYTVVRKLGTGTYGSAYLVCLKGDASARYVLKKIFLQEVSQREREAAEQEVHLLATLDHAFILGYVDSFVYKNHLCIITEYCEAGDLYTYLNSRKSYLPEAQVLEWFVQIALAVQHCHDRKVGLCDGPCDGPCDGHPRGLPANGCTAPWMHNAMHTQHSYPSPHPCFSLLQ